MQVLQKKNAYTSIKENIEVSFIRKFKTITIQQLCD